MDNRTIARQLMHHARFLADQETSLYRVRAYRRAAETVLGLDEPLERIVAERGRRGLRELPAIGSHIARTIETLVRTGAMPTLIDGPHKPREGRSDSRGFGTAGDPCTASAVSSK